MLVSEEQNFIPVESDMIGANSLHELDDSFQDAEMQTKPEHESSYLLPLRRFMDADSLASKDDCVKNSFFNPPSKSVSASQKSRTI